MTVLIHLFNFILSLNLYLNFNNHFLQYTNIIIILKLLKLYVDEVYVQIKLFLKLSKTAHFYQLYHNLNTKVKLIFKIFIF